MNVYEVTLEVKTKLFDRQTIKVTVASQQIVHELRDPDKQRRVGYTFAAVRGPIHVIEATQAVELLVTQEQAAAEAVATGKANPNS